MKTLKKVTVKILYAVMLSALCLTTTNIALGQTYDPYAVEVINKLIDSNGLNATHDSPETWVFATWSDDTPKQLIGLELPQRLAAYTNASFAGLTRLQILHCGLNYLSGLNVANCTDLHTLSCSLNKLTALDLTGLDKLTTFDGGQDRIELHLYGNEVNGYTIAIPLNNPTFSDQSSDCIISYSDGILRTNQSCNTQFTVQTNKEGFDLWGVFLLNCFNSTGIDSPEKLAFNVYPNPANEAIFIDYENLYTVKLYDLQGKEMLSQTANGKTKIDISRLPKGVYIVTVFSEGGAIGSTKITKQ